MGLQADYDLQTDREKADILRTDQCGAISLTVGSPTTMMLRCASL
jgi:hypothetical protein